MAFFLHSSPAQCLCRLPLATLLPSSSSLPPPPFCCVFILLSRAALGRKGRSLHTHTPPCVQLLLSPLSTMGISVGFCHCCVPGGSLPAHRRPGACAASYRNLKPCSLYRVVGPPLLSHCPSCLGMQGLVSLEGEQWAGFLLGLSGA